MAWIKSLNAPKPNPDPSPVVVSAIATIFFLFADYRSRCMSTIQLKTSSVFWFNHACLWTVINIHTILSNACETFPSICWRVSSSINSCHLSAIAFQSMFIGQFRAKITIPDFVSFFLLYRLIDWVVFYRLRPPSLWDFNDQLPFHRMIHFSSFVSFPKVSRVILPPLDRLYLIHFSSFLWILSMIGYQNEELLGYNQGKSEIHYRETLFFLLEKETSFFIINKLNVQESYTMRIIEKPRNEGEIER